MMPFNFIRRFLGWSFVFVAMTTLVACSTTPSYPPNDDLVILHKKSNAEATDYLVLSLANKGYEVKKVTPTQFIVFYDQHTFIMEPKMIQGGLSRIVVSRVIGIKSKYRHSVELSAMTGVLNRKLNFAKFSLIDHNKAGQVQASITFIHETVSIEEIKQFMLWLDASLAQVREMVAPEVLKMMEAPMPITK